MPPKAKPAPAAPGKKADQKKKEKIIEDKTFGLKNKKGAKNQKFIQQVQSQVKYGGNPSARKLELQRQSEQTKKDDKGKEKMELNQLFKPVTTQKVEKGADPKSVLCAFYKQGHCGKGDKCKFSHDLTIERKAEKRSAYVDIRDEDNMENWDEEKLKEVVKKKHEEADMQKPKTEIICKYFLEALEKSKYGWFWECPNGERCIYRHALPPGFILNKDKKKEEKLEQISIEELVETQRAALGSNLTRITIETFMEWKRNKIKQKQENALKEEARKKAEFKAGRSIGLSGREMFLFRPEMAADDDMDDGEAAFDTRNLSDEDDDDVVPVREITLELLASQATEADGSGTIAPADRRARNPASSEDTDELMEGAVGGNYDQDGDTCDTLENHHPPNINGDIPIDEDLFDEDDLSDLDDDMDNLNISQ